MPVIYLMNGHEVEATDEDVAAITKATGLVLIRSCGEIINTSSISHIVPDDRAAEIGRSKMTKGRLHDGTQLVRKFGQWYFSDKPDVMASPANYKQIANDTVWTESEYQKFVKTGEPPTLPGGRSDPKLLGEGNDYAETDEEEA
jgi:hypothetical protein